MLLNSKQRKSFTLIELLVVVAIIGLLATIAILSLNQVRAKARNARRIADLKAFAQAMEMYYLDNNHYPIWDTGGCINDPNTPLTSMLTPDYLGSLPKDPRNVLYCYYYKTQNSGKIYKIAAYMETSTSKATSDGGTADSYYERFSLEEGTQISLTDSDLSGPETAWQLYQDSSIVAYWKMDESSWDGTTGEVTDSSGYGNNGTAYNGATTTGTDCISGRCGSFDGEDDYVNILDSTSLNITGAITIEAWVNFNQVTRADRYYDWQTILMKDRFPDQVYGLMLYTGGTDKHLTFYHTGLSSDTSVYNYNNVQPHVWQHVVVTYDGSSYTRHYINGIEKTSNARDGSINISTEPLSIGKNADSSYHYPMDGLIDEVRIYNRALTACEICERCLEYKDSDFCNNCTPCQ